MIASRAKIADIEQRDWHLAQMQSALKEGLTTTAKTHGNEAFRLAERIKSFDYTKEDEYLAWERKSFPSLWITQPTRPN